MIANAPIVDVATAEAQEDVITAHTLGTLGPYGELERGSDERASYLDGLTIRNSLNMAIMGFKVADLVMGVGAVIVIVGAASLLLLAPLLYWIRQPAAEGQRGTNVWIDRTTPYDPGHFQEETDLGEFASLGRGSPRKHATVSRTTVNTEQRTASDRQRGPAAELSPVGWNPARRVRRTPCAAAGATLPHVTQVTRGCVNTPYQSSDR